MLFVTLSTFVVTALIASIIMYIACHMISLVSEQYMSIGGEVDEGIAATELIVNFFTQPSFTELFSHKAILPLITAGVLFGFGIQKSGGRESRTAELVHDINRCLLKTVNIIMCFAPIGFFGFFANLVANYGTRIIGDYGRTLAVFYAVSFIYMFVFFPIYARFGGGKGAIRIMLSKIFRPAAMSFGSCSSVATIPTNMAVAEETGISKEVADIVIPLGATMHMDGTAFASIIKIEFLFGMFGIDFTINNTFLIMIVSVFAAVSASGIPGGGGTADLIVASMFFPNQMSIAYPLCLAITNIIDPPATMVNSAGDYVAAFIVSRYMDGKDWLQSQNKN